MICSYALYTNFFTPLNMFSKIYNERVKHLKHIVYAICIALKKILI